jgi:hypothetical protein
MSRKLYELIGRSERTTTDRIDLDKSEEISVHSVADEKKSSLSIISVIVILIKCRMPIFKSMDLTKFFNIEVSREL